MSSSKECPIRVKLSNEDLDHEIKMTDAYNELPDSVQDRLTQEEADEFLVDPEGEKAWREDHEKRFRAHITTCQHEDCKRILKNFKEDGLL